MLASVPPPLALALSGGAWMQWERDAEAAVLEALPKREARDLLYDATRWLGKRTVDRAYLVSGPVICCWSDGTDVHLQWDNRDCRLDGPPLWASYTGHHTLRPVAFHGVIERFNERFMGRMADRVAIAQAEWAHPEVALDPHIAEEHRANSYWAQGCLAGSTQAEPDDWEATFAAITRIQDLPRLASGRAERLP
jgi:hypothetical protein